MYSMMFCYHTIGLRAHAIRFRSHKKWIFKSIIYIVAAKMTRSCYRSAINTHASHEILSKSGTQTNVYSNVLSRASLCYDPKSNVNSNQTDKFNEATFSPVNLRIDFKLIETEYHLLLTCSFKRKIVMVKNLLNLIWGKEFNFFGRFL